VKAGLARPVIFGLCDGAMSILGVVFYAAGHTGLVVPLAASGGLTSAVSMAAGEWLSESGNGPAAASAMGLATLAGSVIPAVPYAFLHGVAAPVVSMAACVVTAYVVGRMRGHRKHPVLETLAVLAAVLAVSVACSLLIPGGAPG
jgi:VIT1/CCC1 family predicted Fe2+/Mn2+ transporter